MSKTHLILRVIVTFLIADFAYSTLGYYGAVWAVGGGIIGALVGWYVSRGVTAVIDKNDITRQR